MYKYAVALLGIMSILSAPYSSNAQQADAPVYRDGDWWRIKLEVTRPTGVSVGGPQLGGFPEYRVQINSGKATVIGIRGEQTKELDAPPIISLVLGKSGWRGELLRFPLRVGLTWTDRFQFQPPGTQTRWEEGRYEVQGWEKIHTPRGEFDAFKIGMQMTTPTGPRGKGTAVRTSTYYYAPAVKAIVSFTGEGDAPATTSTFVDFSLSQ